MKLAHILLLLLSSGFVVSAQDLNKAALDAIVQGSGRTGTDALVILKDGEVAYKNYFAKPEKPIEAMSATKSIVSLAIGLLIDNGHLKNLDVPVSEIYPEWRQGKKRLITVRHLLEHTSGLQNLANAGIEVETSPDVVQLALAAEVDHEPGTKFSYNNKATNLLSGVVERASGMKLDAFLKRHLFDELAISDVSWRTDAKGNPLGMAGLQIKAEDLAKIGQLILDKGKWEGKQVISEQWLNQSFAPLAASPESGLMWWLIYEKQYMVIDDAFLEKVRPHADETTLTLLERAKGKYEGFDRIQAHLRSVYSAEEIPLVAKAFSAVPPSQIRIANEGDVVGYAAVGYLGQYLIIIPEKRIVVVRMISADSYKKVPNNSDFSLIRRLAKQL